MSLDEKTRSALIDKIHEGSARFVSVDRSYDIPYLGGYSMDGRTIYLDRRLPFHLIIDDRLTNVGALIQIHERIEKSLIGMMGYRASHAIATFFEHEVARNLNIRPMAYEAAIRPWIRACAHESIRRVPANLDLSPYEQENDRETLEKIMGAQ